MNKKVKRPRDNLSKPQKQKCPVCESEVLLAYYEPHKAYKKGFSKLSIVCVYCGCLVFMFGEKAEKSKQTEKYRCVECNRDLMFVVTQEFRNNKAPTSVKHGFEEHIVCIACKTPIVVYQRRLDNSKIAFGNPKYIRDDRKKIRARIIRKRKGERT